MDSSLLGKIWNEDCLKTMRRMSDGSVDLIVADPPYGIDFVPPRATFTAIPNDGRADAQALWGRFVPEIARVLQPDSFAFLCVGWTELDWVLPLLRDHFTVKSCIVWYKNNFGIGYYTRPQHELNLLCMKGEPPTLEKAPSDVWEIPKESDLLHSCQKPVALFAKAINLFGQKRGTVYDPFVGSGTTAVACERLGRKWIGSEISADYCAIAQKRIDAERSQLKLAI